MLFRSVSRAGYGCQLMFFQIHGEWLTSLICLQYQTLNHAQAESGLSYLGLGVQPPDPSWGRMLKEAQPYISSAPWYVIIVGIVITILVLGFNLLSDGLRDVHDKKA